MRSKFKPLMCLALLAITSCSTVSGQETTLFKMLSNQGPQALNAENPYVAANMLVAQELERSQTFRGFISHAGKPDAVQIKDETFEPSVFYLYYIERLETYALRRNLKDPNEWVVTGPENLPTNIATKISANVMPAPLVNEQTRASLKESAFEKPETQKKIETIKAPSIQQEPVTIAPDHPTLPVKEKLGPQDRAIESQSGDVIHRVSFSGETLRMIAKWYTGDTTNSDRLYRINSLDDPDRLMLGQIIRIPRYLINNKRILTKRDIEIYYSTKN